MQPSFSLSLLGGPGVRITVTETGDGRLQITATLNTGGLIGDLRGLFFHVANESLLAGLVVSDSTVAVGTVSKAANAVLSLGPGVSLAGASGAMDMGIAFGTASAAGADDVRSVSFILSHSSEDLSLALLQEMKFGAVMTSVGTSTGARVGTAKATGTAPANAAPTAEAATLTVAEDGVLTGSVVGLVTDSDSAELTYSLVGAQPAGLVFNDDGSYTYTPPANFDGDVSFQFKANDGSLDSNTATVTIDVTPVNDAPVAANDSASTPEDTALVLSAATMLGNDTDVDLDSLTISSVGAAVHGTVALVAGTVIFTPDANYFGPASFEYTVDDGHGGTNTATVNVTVTPVNDAPVAVNDTASTPEDTPLELSATALLGNDTDVDLDSLTISSVGAAVHGTVALVAGTVIFTPDANYFGPASFEYTVDDGHGGTNTATVNVTVTPVNDAPVAVNDTASTPEDTPLELSVAALLGNDTDVDLDSLTISSVGAAVHGTVALVAGTVIFTPDANYFGPASFEYTVDDGHGGTDTAAVNVTVTPVNDAPVAVNDTASTPEDTPLELSVAALLGNDTDVDLDSLTISSVGAAVHGTVALVAGTVIFTPDANYLGPASFEYTVDDGHGGTNTATVNVNVTPVNDTPLAANDTATTPEDTALVLSAASLLGNDTDVDQDTLTISAVGAAVHGTVALLAGTITFTPDPNYFGPASFEYTVDDGHGGTSMATVTIDVTPVNDAPVAVNDTASTPEDTALVLSAASLLGNDTDVDLDTLTISAVGAAVHGTVALASGMVTFTPDPNYFGPASFEYTVDDGHGGTSTATVTIDVTPVNDGPVAVNDTASTPEDTPLVLSAAALLGNDSDVDVDTLTITSVSAATHGTVALVAGTVTFTPEANYFGPASFEYTVDDGHGSTSTATVTIDVTPVNDAPTDITLSNAAVPENSVVGTVVGTLSALDVDGPPTTFVLLEPAGPFEIVGNELRVAGPLDFESQSSYSITIRALDGLAGPYSETFTIQVSDVNEGGGNQAPVAQPDARSVAEDGVLNASVSASDPNNDSLSYSVVGASPAGLLFNPNGSYTYTPPANFDGDVSFQFKANDGSLDSNTATVTIDVTPVNDAPVAVNDTASTPEDTALVLSAASLLGNDTDVDLDTLTISAVGAAVHGTVALVAGTVTFTPDANYFGPASFEYTVDDGHGGSSTATVNVTVTPVNDAPVAVDDSASTPEDTPLVLSAATLLGNDSDVDLNNLTISAVGAATHGTVTLVADTVTFTPDPNYFGPASFEYTVDDGHGGTGTATVNVTVTPVNDAPQASDDARSVAEDGVLNGSVAGLVTDIDSGSFSFSLVGIAPAGLVFNDDGSYTYTPPADFDGDISFQFKANDGSLNSNTATVTIDVTPVNDAPVAVDDTASTPEDTALVLSAAALLANDSDVDLDTLSISAVGSATHGIVTLVADTVTFTPDANYFGPASFEYTVDDGHGGTNTATVNVTVTPVNDTPLAANDTATTPEDTALVLSAASLLGNDTDVDQDTLTISAVGAAVHGTVALLAGTITFTPDPNYFGPASFKYTVDDGHGGTSMATVTIDVTPVNDAPVAVNDTASTPEDTALVLSAASLLGNDTDVDLDTLTISAVGAAVHGTVALASGMVTFTPDPNYFGPASFEYTVDDGHGGTSTATVTIDVTPVNDGPVAVNDTASTPEDTPLVLSAAALLGNDSDVDVDTLTITSVSAATHGTVALVAGTVTFTPEANYFGPASFEYTVDDGHGSTSTATVTIDVTPVNDAPTDITLSNAAVPENSVVGTVVGTLSALDVDGPPTTFVLLEPAGPFEIVGNELRVAGPLDFESQSSYSITIRALDGLAGPYSETFTIQVSDVNEGGGNQAPVAQPDARSVAEDGVLNASVSASDPNNDSLSYSVVGASPAGLLFNPNGSYTYTPPANFDGDVSFQFKANDGSLDSNTATVTIDVTPVNDAPVAVDDTASTPEDTALVLSAAALLGNDSDVDLDTLTITSVSDATHGTVALVAGTVTFTPEANYFGPASFNYTVSDGHGGSDTATVSVTVTPVNDAPVAVNDTASTPEDTPLVLSAATLLGNDNDVDLNILTITAVAAGTHGTVTLVADTVTFTPDPNYFGPASFEYTVDDGHGGTSTATVTIDVTPVNDAPVAVNDTASTPEDTPRVLSAATLLGNDTDVDLNILTITAVAAGTHGTVTLVADTVTFTPDPNYFGPASFEYTVDDGHGGTSTATVNVTVTPVNDTPTAPTGVSATVAEDQTTTFTLAQLLAGAGDVDGDTVTVQSFIGGSNVTGFLHGGGITVGGSADYNGPATATYRLSDGHGGTVDGVISLTVTPVNDAPAVTTAVFNGVEDTPRVFSIASLIAQVASDVDLDPLSLVSITSVHGGSVSIAGDVLTFTPTADFSLPSNGQAWFYLTVTDGLANAGNWQYINFADVNDAPQLSDDFIVRQPGPQVIPFADLFANDSDIDTPKADWTVASVGGLSGVTVAVDNTARTLTITYAPGHIGEYSFTYTVQDNEGGTDTAKVTLNGAPVAVDDTDTIGENTAYSLYHLADVLANDSDPDGDARTLTSVTALTPGIVPDISGNQLRYYINDPNNDTFGTFQVQYTVSDGRGGSDTGVLTVTVQPEDDAPKPKPDNAGTEIVTTGQFTPIDIPFATLLANDTHPDGTAFTITAVHNMHLGSAALVDTNGDTVVDAVRFTPHPNSGTFQDYSDSWLAYFYYQVTDTDGDATSTYAYVRVNDVNEAPLASDDLIGRAGDPQTIDFVTLFGNDVDFDSPKTAWTISAITNATGVTVTVDNTTRTIGVDYVDGHTGDYYFDYTVVDGEGGLDTARVTLNTAPVAVDDSYVLDENTIYNSPQALSVLTNDSDSEGDPLKISAISVLGGAPAVAYGIGGTTLYFYLTDPYFNSLVQVSYTVSDGRGGSDTALVAVNVTPQNDAPYDPQGNDNALSLTVAEDTPLVISISSLLGDDLDPEGNAISLSDVFSHSGGSVVNNGNGTLTFTPVTNFNGGSGISYRAQDTLGALGLHISVPIQVTPVEDAPVAADDYFSRALTATQTLTFDQLRFNDSDADNVNSNGGDDDTLTITAVAAISGGTPTIVGDTVVFTFSSGLAQFSYTLSDGTTTDTATVTLNGLPAAVDDAVTIDENSLASSGRYANVVSNDTDPNGDALFVTGATVLGGAPVVAYAWGSEYVYFYSTDPDFNGVVEIDYTVSDGFNSDTGRLTVTVEPTNDGPFDPEYDDLALGLTGVEDTPLEISVDALLADDVNPADEAQVVTLYSVYSVYGGSIDINGDGTLTFTPNEDFEGTGYFYYYAIDEQGTFGNFVYVPVSFSGTPDPIVAVDDVVTRTGTTSQTVTAATMKNNDIDPDVGDLKNITTATAGTGLLSAVLNIDDSVEVVFDPGFEGLGRAFFDYTVTDSLGPADIGRVFLNRAPVAVPDGPIAATEADNYVFVPYSTLLGNDTDPDGPVDVASLVVQGVQPGSHISSVSMGWFQDGQFGLRAYLADPTFTGTAEFSYRVRDGDAVTGTVSNFATVTLSVGPGNDAPVSGTDYWFKNGAMPNDTVPGTNGLAGVEDQVLDIPVSLLLDGQSIDGVYQGGRDTDEEGDTLALVADSLFSYYGTVELIGDPESGTVRFTPNLDVNSDYPGGGIDTYGIWFQYRVSDGLRESTAATVYLYVASSDDVPEANDDTLLVPASEGSWSLDIADYYGPYGVQANDVSPDDYPYSGNSGYSNISSVAAVSGILNLSWNGYTVTVTPDGSGDPIVFEYTLEDSDGDTDTALVTLNPVIADQAFYFSGVSYDGRELWIFDPDLVSPSYGVPVATMVDEAQTLYGFEEGGHPQEITALDTAAFWRATVDSGEDGIGDHWNTYQPLLGYQDLETPVGYDVFDAGLPQTEQNLGIRSGQWFWGATTIDGDALLAWDSFGTQQTFVTLPGSNRELLSDAGGDPAFSAQVPTDLYEDELYVDTLDAEQVFVVVHNPWNGSWSLEQVTDGGGIQLGQPSNDVREITGLHVVEDELNFGQLYKTIYFTGDFTSDLGEFHADALWRVDMFFDSDSWSGPAQPQFLDNGSIGVVPTEARELTLATVTDEFGGTVERLFLFQRDAAGNGQIASIYHDPSTGAGNSTGTDHIGLAFDGIDIEPWLNGVVFSGTDSNGAALVDIWTDDDGDGSFELSILWWSDSSETIKHLEVDGAGNLAFVVDQGAVDVLYRSDGNSLFFVDYLPGEVTDLQMAAGFIVYSHLSVYGDSSLYSYSIATEQRLDVSTDESVPFDTGDGFTGARNSVALPGGLAFNGHVGTSYTLHVTDGTDVTDSGVNPYATGFNLGSDWVGVGYSSATNQLGLLRVEMDGAVTVLYDFLNTVDSSDVAGLGTQVVFGARSGAVSQVMAYDSVSDSSVSILTGDYLLGRVETVGSEIIFNAKDATDSIWRLYSYNGSGLATELATLPAAPGNGQPVYDYTPNINFLGDASHLYWKQGNALLGEELHVLDRSTGTITVVDINPGLGSGGNWGDAVFANDRMFWQASADGTVESMRLYTSQDGTAPTEITGPLLLDGYQFPWIPVTIGERVYFQAQSLPTGSGGSGSWAIFEINSDGLPGTADDVTAAMVSPTSFGFITGLTAIGLSLYFVEQEDGFDEMWSLTPGGVPVQVTSFATEGHIGDIFAGGDGRIYFGRDEPGLGRELWVLDDTESTGARLVVDLNTDVPAEGFQPQQLVGVPDPLQDAYVPPVVPA